MDNSKRKRKQREETYQRQWREYIDAVRNQRIIIRK